MPVIHFVKIYMITQNVYRKMPAFNTILYMKYMKHPPIAKILECSRKAFLRKLPVFFYTPTLFSSEVVFKTLIL